MILQTVETLNSDYVEPALDTFSAFMHGQVNYEKNFKIYMFIVSDHSLF